MNKFKRKVFLVFMVFASTGLLVADDFGTELKSLVLLKNKESKVVSKQIKEDFEQMVESKINTLSIIWDSELKEGYYTIDIKDIVEKLAIKYNIPILVTTELIESFYPKIEFRILFYSMQCLELATCEMKIVTEKE